MTSFYFVDITANGFNRCSEFKRGKKGNGKQARDQGGNEHGRLARAPVATNTNHVFISFLY